MGGEKKLTVALPSLTVMVRTGGSTAPVASRMLKTTWLTGPVTVALAWMAVPATMLAAMGAMPDCVPLVITGDLHATAEGRILASGNADFSRRSVIAALPGASGTSAGGWASDFRGVGPLVSNHLQMEETVRPIQENGFSLLDLTPEAITIR